MTEAMTKTLNKTLSATMNHSENTKRPQSAPRRLIVLRAAGIVRVVATIAAAIAVMSCAGSGGESSPAAPEAVAAESPAQLPSAASLSETEPALPTGRDITANVTIPARAMPAPELSRVDPAVRARIERQQANLAAVLANAAATPAERAGAHGALGKIYFAGMLFDLAEASLDQAASLAPGDYRWPHYLGDRKSVV